MGRPRDVATLLQEGLGPAQIATRLGISINSVRQYLWVAVGEGLIRRSDVLFSLPKPLRQSVERALRSGKCADIFALQGSLFKEKVAYKREEVEMLWTLTTTRAGHGDLYEYITSAEKLLHERIRQVLTSTFGESESGWWRKGIPEKVRLDCRTAQEKDTEADPDPFAYTTLIHLREILDRHWPLFQDRLPKEIVTNKKEFLSDLENLNGVRNRVMHPTRLHHICDADFEFAREMHRKLRAEAWREPPLPG